MQGGGGRHGDRRDLDGDAGLRRGRLLAAHRHRAPVPRRPCGRGDGTDRRRAARVHRQGDPGHTAVLSEDMMSRAIWVGAVAYDPKVVTIWEGMRRYFHEEAHLPVEIVL